MALWKRDAETDLVALAAAVPDAVAVLDDAGGLIGWDESAAHAYLERHGLPGCDEVCRKRGHFGLF